MRGSGRRSLFYLILIASTPFERVAMGVVGKISPLSNSDHQFIIILFDCTACFIETVPLNDITSFAIAEALLLISPP